ncbi:serine/threonine-protein kinase [Tuwongella immobilis]|nr:serine/threonine-protein kinase [Tuwongella immobilis]
MAEDGIIQSIDPRRLITYNGIDQLIDRSEQFPPPISALPPAPPTPPVAPAPTPAPSQRPTQSERITEPASSPPVLPSASSESTIPVRSVDEVSQPDLRQTPPIGSTQPAKSDQSPTAIGSTLGRCLLLEKVGEGGAGSVYRALHRTLNIPVAVKVFRRSVMESGPDTFNQFRAEARLLAQLNHPNVVRVWDFEDDPQYPFLVLEFVEGLTLAELIAHSGRVQPEPCVALMIQVCMGLKAAQQLGIVHRDVKPANVLITRQGDAKLADLGLAVVVAGKLAGDPQLGPSGGLAGTAAYMSPEQALGSQTVDHRSDIYALGATFYHAITGEMPFTGKRTTELLMKQVNETPRAPHVVVPELDPMVTDIIMKMMAKDPNERFANYDELIAKLQELRTRIAQGGLFPPAQQPPSFARQSISSYPGISKTVSDSESRSAGSSMWKAIRRTFSRKKPDDSGGGDTDSSMSGR